MSSDRSDPGPVGPSAEPSAAANRSGGEVHVGDNYLHLLAAVADLAGRGQRTGQTALVLFITDRLPLPAALSSSLASLTGAEIARVSDDAAIESFARLPRWVPPMLRRNVSWTASGRPVRPHGWTSDGILGDRRFDVAYVYHPGFFLSKVVAGHARHVIMRESGYANYVRHRVPIARAVPRLLAGRPARHQTWGEESWIDEIQLVRPDDLPERVRHKATRFTIDDAMRALPTSTSRAIAAAFWGDEPPMTARPAPTALLLTQPIDQLGICSTVEKHRLYSAIADRLTACGYSIVVKSHPRELEPSLAEQPHLPRAFPIEGWKWLGRRPFDLAVALNSTSLVDESVSFAADAMQLIPPLSFYPVHWSDWPHLIDTALARLSCDEQPARGPAEPAEPPTRSTENDASTNST